VVEGKARYSFPQLPWLVAQSVYHPQDRLIFGFFLLVFVHGTRCCLVNITDTFSVFLGVSSYVLLVLGGSIVVVIYFILVSSKKKLEVLE